MCVLNCTAILFYVHILLVIFSFFSSFFLLSFTSSTSSSSFFNPQFHFSQHSCRSNHYHYHAHHHPCHHYHTYTICALHTCFSHLLTLFYLISSLLIYVDNHCLIESITGRLLDVLSGHEGPIACLDFSQITSTLASGTLLFLINLSSFLFSHSHSPSPFSSIYPFYSFLLRSRLPIPSLSHSPLFLSLLLVLLPYVPTFSLLLHVLLLLLLSTSYFIEFQFITITITILLRNYLIEDEIYVPHFDIFYPYIHIYNFNSNGTLSFLSFRIMGWYDEALGRV